GFSDSLALFSFPTRRSSDLEVTAPPFGQGKFEVQAAFAAQVGQVLEDNLFLEGHGRGRHHNLFAQSLGYGQGGQKVGDGFTGSRDRKSTRLNSSHVKSSYAV